MFQRYLTEDQEDEFDQRFGHITNSKKLYEEVVKASGTVSDFPR
jgi:hypothetical protein